MNDVRTRENSNMRKNESCCANKSYRVQLSGKLTYVDEFALRYAKLMEVGLPAEA
jgi:hypothetical protein